MLQLRDKQSQLRARVEDDENNRFRVLCDQQGRYVLGESDYDFWADDVMGQNPAASDFNGDFFNRPVDKGTCYFDGFPGLPPGLRVQDVVANITGGGSGCSV